MKAKTLVQLLSLSVSLYSISKDEELMKKVSEFTKKGKDKLNDLYEDFSGDSEEELTEKIINTAKKAKEELEKKVEETVERVYEKMKIAHTKDLEQLRNELNLVKQELARAEARIVNLENSTL